MKQQYEGGFDGTELIVKSEKCKGTPQWRDLAAHRYNASARNVVALQDAEQEG
jgi:hypothetical protein